MKKRKILAILMVSIIISAFVSGCANDNTPANNSEDPGQTPADNTASEPKVGGELVVGITGDPYSLATWNSNDMNSSMIMNLVLPALMVTDENANKVPYIVKDYNISDDALVYTVTIHDGLSWHDGVPFTVEDLAFTADYAVKYKLGYGADMYASVEKTEIVDDTTIKYYLSSPQVNFLSQMGFWVDIMPKHVFENVDDPANYDYDGLGFGPYKVKDYVKGQYYVLERVENWPLANDGQGAYLDTITFRVFPDANALVLAIMNGEVDVSGSALPIAAQKQLEAEPDKFGIEKVNSLGFGYFSFNYKNELLSDQKVREAIAMTIDRDALVNIAIQGGAIKMYTPISPVFPDLVKSDIKYPAFDIEGANKLLDEAGYSDTNGDGVREGKNGKLLEFDLIYRTSTANIDSIANIFKANAEKAGIKINLQPVDPATYTDKVVKQKTFDINVIDWGVIDDPDSSLSTIYKSDAALNIMSYKNDKLDELLEKSASEPNYEKRIEIMNEFQKEFVKELPSINTWVRINAYGYSKDFDGWEITPGLYGLMDVKDLVKVYKK